MATVTMTELLRNPKGVIRRLEETHDLVIERRDQAPLRLTLNSREEADHEGAAMLARVLSRALPRMPELRDLLWTFLVDAYPWLRFLPEAERSTFLREFTETVEACASLGSNAALSQLLHEWKATAAVYSDPALTAVLKRRSAGTKTRVSRPRSRR